MISLRCGDLLGDGDQDGIPDLVFRQRVLDLFVQIQHPTLDFDVGETCIHKG